MSATVDNLTAAHFGLFFQELWGDDHPPYDWQRSLAERVIQSADDRWPEAIALPTAAGKTACVDIAVFAMAVLADTERGTTPHPRRLFYTVDRRNIVDQTYDRANVLADKLAQAQDGILHRVADRLRRLAGGDNPLAVHRLRGGIRGASSWERNPRQPAVITTTVDQVGSALLFGAYGKGRGVRPVHAGLAANDSIIILDEAHCAQPFLQTLRAVRKYRQWAECAPVAPFQAVIMSATPPDGVAAFNDDSSQQSDPNHLLGRRQLAPKPATLAIAKRVPRNGNALVALGQELAAAALDLAGQGVPTAVVFANRVATAREAYRIIREQNTADAVLITGRMRQRERDEAMNILLPRVGPDADRSAPDSRPLIAIATQTLEIGADLDFDGLVTECASLDALRQRFGRLNRAGRDIAAPGRIIIRADQVKADAPDPIYGGAISATWQWLNESANALGEIDFGIANIAALLPDTNQAELNPPAENATVMLPAHIDAWAQTGPDPETGPAPFLDTYLHGPRTAPADVQVCWRAGLDLSDRDQVREILQLCPPSSMEMAPVPFIAFRNWLAASSDADDTGDSPGGIGSETGTRDVADDRRDRSRVIVANRNRRRRDDQPIITANPRRIRPGDTVVIPSEHSGNPHDIVDMLPDDAALLDIGDEAMRRMRGKPTLRLIADQLANANPQVSELIHELRESESTDAARQSLMQELLKLLIKPEVSGIPAQAKCSADALLKITGDLRLYQFDRQLIIQSRRPQSAAAIEQPDDADDVTHSRRARRVSLVEHSRGVQEWAVAYARGCGISGPTLEAIRCAARLHDVGKADPLFQRAMHDGNRYYDPTLLLAKSPGARRPPVRHELMSVRMAESNAELLPDDPDAKDLALHLIASHHGYCRPFAPFRPADLKPRAAEFEIVGASLRGEGPTGLERLDSGVAERYWRLTRRYGWWGLAYLEAILRVADWSRSQWEETQ